MAERTFLGVGWKFPVQVDAGKVAVSRSVELVEASLRMILGTARGERIMRPDFGSDLNRLVFSPNNASTAGLAIYYVQQSLKRWEPRVELVNVDANPDPENAHILLIAIDYRIIETNTERNLVYPFYLGGQ